MSTRKACCCAPVQVPGWGLGISGELLAWVVTRLVAEETVCVRYKREEFNSGINGYGFSIAWSQRGVTLDQMRAAAANVEPVLVTRNGFTFNGFHSRPDRCPDDPRQWGGNFSITPIWFKEQEPGHWTSSTSLTAHLNECFRGIGDECYDSQISSCARTCVDERCLQTETPVSVCDSDFGAPFGGDDRYAIFRQYWDGGLVRLASVAVDIRHDIYAAVLEDSRTWLPESTMRVSASGLPTMSGTFIHPGYEDSGESFSVTPLNSSVVGDWDGEQFLGFVPQPDRVDVLREEQCEAPCRCNDEEGCCTVNFCNSVGIDSSESFPQPDRDWKYPPPQQRFWN